MPERTTIAAMGLHIPPDATVDALPVLAVLAVAAVLYVLGLLIIRRITRNPDEGPDHWRSHRH